MSPTYVRYVRGDSCFFVAPRILADPLAGIPASDQLNRPGQEASAWAQNRINQPVSGATGSAPPLSPREPPN